MIYTEKLDDKLVVSKNRIAVLPNQKEVEEMVELENTQTLLWKEVKDAVSKKVRIDNDYDFRIGTRASAEFISAMIFGGVDLGVLVASLSRLEFSVNPVVLLAATNIAFGTSIFICASSKYKLKKEKKKINVKFNQIKDTIHNEINRQNDIQNAIPGDNVSLATSFVKIKSL